MNSSRYSLQQLINILEKFRLDGIVKDIVPFGSGHINDTYRIVNAMDGKPDYLLQRINHQIFKDVPALIENIRMVTAHLKEKLERSGDAYQKVLTLIPTKNDQFYIEDDLGNFWRIYNFLNDTRSYDVVQTTQQAYEGGCAFGKFQTLLTDIDVSKLAEVIPDFHNIDFRLQQFKEALLADALGRAEDVAAEIEFVHQYAWQMGEIQRLKVANVLPLRITHNDTKFNNVLLNEKDEAICVIDLDTVMPGMVAFDFGDAVRTIINTAPEDEADLDKIQLNLPLFEAFSKGFLSHTASVLTQEEIASLFKGVLLLPFMIGLRFLTDYINGDVYYKVAFEGHNLQRARAQFELFRKLKQNEVLLQEIILADLLSRR